MEAEAEEVEEVIECPVEFEDITMSDDEVNTESGAVQLTIDGNSRIVSKGSRASDQQYCERESNHSTFQSSCPDLFGDTSSEELDLSDDGATCSYKYKEINLDGMVCPGIDQHFDVSSSFNHSSTVFKNECLTDNDEDISIFERRSMASRYGHTKTLASSLSVSSVFASVRDFFSGKPEPNSSTYMSVSNPFTNAVYMKNEKSGNLESPLMTCVEFLKNKSEMSDDEGTDIEEMEFDSKGIHSNPTGSIHSNCGRSILDDSLRCRGKGDFMSSLQSNSRRSSWTTEMLSDDESSSVGNENVRAKSKTKKRNSYSNVYEDPNDCLTDEEVVDVGEKEWTETDGSGSVRQITQIKTETSINFEGDDAVKSLRKVPEKDPSDAERKGSTDSEADDLSFTEKKSYFQRLSLTSDNIPGSNKYIQDTSMDDLPMAEGEIVVEKISFEDKLKMFEPDKDNRKKIQKREKQEQPTVYRYDFTKNGTELEKAEDIVRQVNEELDEEDDLDDAVALDKVEKEVRSLVSEVDKEEEESKEILYDAGNVAAEREPVMDSPSETQELSMLEDITEESKSVYSERVVEQETQLEVEENDSPAPVEETTYVEGIRVHLENERDLHKGRLSLELCKQDELHEAIKLDEDDGIDLSRPSVDSHIKSEILQEEIDQSIEESPLEVKHIVEELQEISAADDHKCDVYKQIRTEIFSQELGADIESGSPERKELGAFSSKKSDKLSDSDEDKPDEDDFAQHDDSKLPLSGVDSKENSELSKKSDSDSDDDKPDAGEFVQHDDSKLTLFGFDSKGKSNDMSKMSDNLSDSDDDKPDSAEFAEHENTQLPLSSIDSKEKLSDALSFGLEKEGIHKGVSPQISEDSCGQTDEISSEGVIVEPDEQLFDYEEAKDEHSLTEQLQALASDSQNTAKKLIVDPLHTMEFGTHEFDNLSSGMSSSISDLEVHRRTKDIAFSRHDKKEIRSLKSTKQVSTIEEHSSIESCDSPQDLMLQELPEKYDVKESSDIEDDNNQELGAGAYSAKASASNITKGSISTDDFSSKDRGSSPENEKSNLPSGSESDIDPSCLPRLSDNSDKSSKISRSDSKSSHSKKSDSDVEGSKHDSTSGKRKEESCSSSGETESPYYSVETSDSGRTPRSTPAASRPCSSEFDINVFSGHGSEYETCVTSQGISGEGSGSYATAVSSQEISYATACSSFSHSSRESAYSVDSESSGHLASVEVSSEASETLVPPAIDMEMEFSADLEMPVLDEEPTEEDSLKEPYDMDIPDDVIRGGIEVPFMKNWDMNDSTSGNNEEMKQLPQQWSWQFATESEVTEKFEVLENQDDILAGSKGDLSIVKPETEESSANNAKSIDTAQALTSYTHSGPSHRRSFSSVMDINLDKEPMEQNATIVDEEQLSVSESSATHSEQTWQTSSIDTAVLLSSHALLSDGPNVMLDSFQETPPEKELTTELGTSSNLESSYLQLNGPVEVDYNPDYDNPDDGDSELTSNQIQSSIAYENEGLQFDLEMEGSLSASDAANNATGDTLEDLETNLDNISGVDEGNIQSGLDDHQATQSSDFELQNNISLDADQPEAQQEQSLSFRNYDHQESESFVCSDLTSYLPESDQADLLSGVVDSLPPSFESEINIPIAGSASSNEGLSNVEARVNLSSDLAGLDCAEKVDMVDTSPEDERYEYKSMKASLKSPKEENADLNFSPSSHDDILNPESDYVPQNFASKYDDVPGTDLYTHQEEEEYDIRRTNLSPILSVEESKGSTPSSFPGRRFFPRSGDTSAASSLQEFERLEADIAAGRISRSSIDSTERMAVTKSGEHDDVSMSSLNEFEKIEKECVEQPDNKGGIEDIMMLSEIEEGMESQCSDALEILQEGSEAAEYERRRMDIEQVIKVAQCNVEKFQDETFSEGVTSDECTVLMRGATSETQDVSSEETKASSKEGGNNTDFEESEHLVLTLENDSTTGGHDSSSSGDKNCARMDCMVSSTDSMDPSSSTATHATYQFETDSVMSSSLNSAQASGEECTMVSSTDTLEPEYKLTYSHGDSGMEERTQVSSRGDETIVHSKGPLECKLMELQTTNGAKQQMEMFLSKLTDESVLMDDFTSHSFPDTLEESELRSAPDDLLQSIEAAQGVSSSGDGSALDEDGLVSTTTTSTTTRVVTSVIGDPDGQSEFQSTFVQQLSDDDIRQSCEITVNEVLNESATPKESDE